MNQAEKNEVIGELSEKFGKAPLVACSQYRGLTVAQMTELRGELRKVEGELLVAKNTLVWRAVGDAESTAQLPDSVMTIGKKRSSGHGLVLGWAVEEVVGGDEWEFGHLHPDGTPGRTVPPTCLTTRSGIERGGEGRMGLRPPYIHVQCRANVVLPAA